MMVTREAIIEALRKDFEEAVRTLFGREMLFINPKVHRNTLADSHLREDMEVRNDGGVINIFLNDYYQYIESGRKPFAKKVPLEALRDWAREKLGTTDNKVLFAVQNSIYYYGIKARPILTEIDAETDRAWDWRLADNAFSKITENIDLFFS